MEKTRRSFSWYWLLEPEVILALAMGIFIGFFVFVPHRPHLTLALSVCLGLALSVAIAFQRILYKRMGPHKVMPPKLFTVFWQMVIALEFIGMAAGIIMYLLGK